MSLDARLRHPSCTREQVMPAYGYARISRGRGDGTDMLQNQRMRLTGAGVDPAHIHEDIIMGTVMRRPGLSGLPEVSQPGDILLLTALDRLGRDTLGLLRWSGRGSAGAGHAGHAQKVAVTSPRVPGGGVGGG